VFKKSARLFGPWYWYDIISKKNDIADLWTLTYLVAFRLHLRIPVWSASIHRGFYNTGWGWRMKRTFCRQSGWRRGRGGTWRPMVASDMPNVICHCLVCTAFEGSEFDQFSTLYFQAFWKSFLHWTFNAFNASIGKPEKSKIGYIFFLCLFVGDGLVVTSWYEATAKRVPHNIRGLS
jgi:hypothetical protein